MLPAQLQVVMVRGPAQGYRYSSTTRVGGVLLPARDFRGHVRSMLFYIHFESIAYQLPGERIDRRGMAVYRKQIYSGFDHVCAALIFRTSEESLTITPQDN